MLFFFNTSLVVFFVIEIFIFVIDFTRKMEYIILTADLSVFKQKYKKGLVKKLFLIQEFCLVTTFNIVIKAAVHTILEL